MIHQPSLHLVTSTMLRRLFSGPLRFHLRVPLQTPASPLLPPSIPPVSRSGFNHTSELHFRALRLYSTSGRDGSDGPGDIWKTFDDAEEPKSSLFGDDAFGSGPAGEVNLRRGSDAWEDGSTEETKVDLFADVEQEDGASKGGDDEPWWVETEEKGKGGLFGSLEEREVGLEGFGGGLVEERKKKVELSEAEIAELDEKEKELRATLKGLEYCF